MSKFPLKIIGSLIYVQIFHDILLQSIIVNFIQLFQVGCWVEGKWTFGGIVGNMLRVFGSMMKISDSLEYESMTFCWVWFNLNLGSLVASLLACCCVEYLTSPKMDTRKFSEKLGKWWCLHHPLMMSMLACFAADQVVIVSHSFVAVGSRTNINWLLAQPSLKWVAGNLSWLCYIENITHWVLIGV